MANVSQKTIKLDPDAYQKLKLTKEALQKYLHQSFSMADTVRFLMRYADASMTKLLNDSQIYESDLQIAKGNREGYEPDYVRRIRELAKS